MKKVLTTALVIGSLYGTAQAATITSPIYMPTTGEMITSLDVGYTKSTFDKVEVNGAQTGTREFEKSWNLNLNGEYGLNEKVSLNYGFDFDFNREMNKTDQSAKLTNAYIGFTGRVFDSDAYKLDVLFNVGQQAEKYWTNYDNDQTYANLALRYGLDLDMYNVAITVGSQYTNEYRYGTVKIDSEFNFFAKLENELIFTDKLTMGLDLLYTYNPKNNYKYSVYNDSYKAFSEYGINADLNYALDDNNYLGVYVGMLENNYNENNTGSQSKDLTEYNGGVRLTTRF
ncbi:MAG: hypothetical protein PHY80_05100 [Rickettsiales bacterium]|nr:hypothetical protein [Rickettsiales bacterium]